MRIKRFTIKNYKSIGAEGVTIEFRDKFCVLVGRNNAGKSNILEAIGLLFGPRNPRYVQIGPEAYNDPSQPIVIEAELEGLTWNDGKALGLSDQQCAMLMHEGKKVSTKPGSVVFRLTCPPAEEVTEDAEEGEEGPAKQTFEVELADHYPMKRNEAFRKAAVRHLLVPPVRSHTEQLTPSMWTSYGQLLRDILSESPEAEELSKLIRLATEQLQALLDEEAAQLTRTAKSTSYVDSINFQLTRDGSPAELLRNLSLAVSYRGRTEDISQVGTGTQSAVIIGILELCLRYRSTAGIRLFAVEEPELYLHPHAQRYMARLLRAISEEEGSQVILTTHSADILTGADVRDIVRVERDAGGSTCCRSIPPEDLQDERFQRILSSEAAEMWFADRVVLVEGPSEVILFPRLARILAERRSRELDFDYKNVSVINVGGKDALWSYANLLRTLGIDWRVVADRDALEGGSLQPFKRMAGLSGNESPDEQIEQLKRHGVAVLTKGEIEDHYPDEALAEIAGCRVEDVPREKERRRVTWDDPSTFELVKAIIRDHRAEICRVSENRLEKELRGFYSQAVDSIRRSGKLTKVTAKTGDILTRWLGLSKPALAHRVADWFEGHPDKIPKDLSEIMEWLVAGTV